MATTKPPFVSSTSSPFSPSPPSLYYFKPVDSTVPESLVSSTSSTPADAAKDHKDNLALPSANFDPTYIVYPELADNQPHHHGQRAKSTSSPQKYLKKPTYGYDAASAGKSIFREETAKFHSANLVQIHKVIFYYLDPS